MIQGNKMTYEAVFVSIAIEFSSVVRMLQIDFSYRLFLFEILYLDE